MGLLKQLMIFGKSGLQGLPTRVALFPWAFSRQGATGFPLLTTWDSVAGLGRAPIPENISGRKLTQVLNSVGSVLVHHRYVTKRPRTGEGCDLGNSGVWDRDYGWGVRVRRPFGARTTATSGGSINLLWETPCLPASNTIGGEIASAPFLS